MLAEWQAVTGFRKGAPRKQIPGPEPTHPDPFSSPGSMMEQLGNTGQRPLEGSASQTPSRGGMESEAGRSGAFGTIDGAGS